MSDRHARRQRSKSTHVSKIRELFEAGTPEETQAISRAGSNPNIAQNADETTTNDTQNDSPSLREIEEANRDLDRWISTRRSKYKKNDEKQITSSRKRLMQQKSKSMLDDSNEYDGESGWTEEYRRSLLGEMDLELEKMKNDGFIEDEDQTIYNVYDEFSTMYASTNNPVYENVQSNNGHSTEEYMNVFNAAQEITNTNDSKNKNATDAACQTDPNLQNGDTKTPLGYTDEDFGWLSLFQDEQEYYLEAYNNDGEELVMSYVEIVRKSAPPDEKNESEYALVFESEDSVQETPDSSKRNTAYSTDSCYSDRMYEEEYVVERMLDKCDENIDSARRETIIDNRGVVRIERDNKPTAEQFVEDESDGTTEDVAGDQGTLKFIFQEIKQTEKKYVSDLRKVVREYKPYVEKHRPQNAIGKASYIFGNIESIYRSQRQFLKDLEACANVKCIVQKFIDHEDLFALYPQYFKNKPKADATLKEYANVVKRRQRELEDKLDISAYLLTPLQRLGKYKLFLENILKHYERNGENTGTVQMALKMIRDKMQNGNDLLAIESIVENPIEKFTYGSFMRREKFLCVKPSKREVVVFLFKEILIFTTENQNKRNLEEFHYWTSIKMRDLRIATYDENLYIHLTDFSKSKRKSTLLSKYTIILEAKDEKCKETWRKDIEDILWKQLEQDKASTLKEFQKKLKKPPPDRKPRVKSTGSSTFYTFN